MIQETPKDTLLKTEQEGSNLVAGKDGTVIGIITRSGIPKVSEGAEVKKGDVLVEGCIPIYNEDTTVRHYEYCTADADVLLRCRYQMTDQLNETYEKKVYTGREVRRRYLLIGSRKIQFPIFGNGYEAFDVLDEKERLTLFGGYELPVYFGKISKREYVKEKRIYSKDEIKEKFEGKVQKFIQYLEEKGVQITGKDVTIKRNKGVWSLQVDFTAEENTGTPQKIEQKPLEDGQEE